MFILYISKTTISNNKDDLGSSQYFLECESIWTCNRTNGWTDFDELTYTLGKHIGFLYCIALLLVCTLKKIVQELNIKIIIWIITPI